jgi:hypothetical protein
MVVLDQPKQKVSNTHLNKNKLVVVSHICNLNCIGGIGRKRAVLGRLGKKQEPIFKNYVKQKGLKACFK